MSSRLCLGRTGELSRSGRGLGVKSWLRKEQLPNVHHEVGFVGGVPFETSISPATQLPEPRLDRDRDREKCRENSTALWPLAGSPLHRVSLYPSI